MDTTNHPPFTLLGGIDEYTAAQRTAERLAHNGGLSADQWRSEGYTGITDYCRTLAEEYDLPYAVVLHAALRTRGGQALFTAFVVFLQVLCDRAPIEAPTSTERWDG